MTFPLGVCIVQLLNQTRPEAQGSVPKGTKGGYKPMSAITLTGSSRKRQRRTRGGEASVVTDEVLDFVRSEVEDLENDDDVFVLEGAPRPTPGSAAGLGYQIKSKLEERDDFKVHSSPVPCDLEAWNALTDEQRSPAGIQTIKKGNDETLKAAIRHYPAFHPFSK